MLGQPGEWRRDIANELLTVQDSELRTQRDHEGERVRRRHRSPLSIRRFAYGLMALAALVGGLSGADESPLGMTAVLALAVAATAFYTRANDILLDFDFRGVRRQATIFCIVGMLAALLGCVAASQLTGGRSPIVVRTLGYASIGGGIAAGLSGLVTLLWSFSGTYAGEQIEKRSQEEW